MMDTQQQEALVFKIDEKLLQRRPPRLTLAATLKALSKQIKLEDLDSNFVVDILHENQLLPYLISSGYNYKQLLDVSLGKHTNASKVGDIIVSEECIRGTYELCIAFLDFILTIISNTKYRDTTKTILASLTYISNEIYTSHHIWTYRNIKDMEKISSLCTEIFNHIILNTNHPNPTSSHTFTDLELICILNLSHNQAHKQLLDVIVDGKKTIEKKIDELKLKDEQGLKNEASVICVRQSLFIFNKLLSHSKHIKDFCNNGTASPKTHGASSSTAPMTNLEKALFDTSIRPGLLQSIFSYIYQKLDSETACLAVDLIKNVAKKFSMSLMACLGSEADKVCQFFLRCLSSSDANTNLEVAILDLLSTCVKHQPGLIELFLNYKQDLNGEDDTTQKSSLKVVSDLLEKCKDSRDESSKNLHTYVMKFILTFWQKNHSAIEQFDKADGFWKSINHPLIEFLQQTSDVQGTQQSKGNTNKKIEELDDRLRSYALMILAREIFCLNVGLTERKMNTNLRDILEDFSKKNLLSKYSTHIKKRYLDITSNNGKTGDDQHKLLAAWRDFLASFSKFKPIDLGNAIQNQIINNMLSCIILELRLGLKLNKERIATIGDTLLLVWTKWNPKSSTEDQVFNSIHEILYLADAIKETLPFTFLLTFQSTLNIYLVRHKEYLMSSTRSFDLLVPSLQLMQFSLKVMEQYVNTYCKDIEFNYKPAVESRLCLSSIMTLKFIIEVSKSDVELWNQYFQINFKIDYLVQFLTQLMNKRVGAEICLSIVELLLSLSSIKETAEYLNKATLIYQVNMIAVSAYERPFAHLSQLATASPMVETIGKPSLEGSNIIKTAPLDGIIATSNNPLPLAPAANIMSDAAKIYLDGKNSDLNWLPIYWHIIRLNVSMLLTLDGNFMTTAVEFLSIHCIRICELLELLRTKPRSIHMDEVLQIIYMINLVLKHKVIWMKKNGQSYNAISEEFAKTAYTLATSALPPPTPQAPNTDQNQLSNLTLSSIKPRDCLIYAKCCFDFGKHTEAERVLFQTKFGDKNGFIKEAAQIYGDQLSGQAFHLAAMICLKTNRQQDGIDFALQVFGDDCDYSDVVSILTQNRN